MKLSCFIERSSSDRTTRHTSAWIVMLLTFVFTITNPAYSQDLLSRAEANLKHDFDSLVKWQRVKFPNAGLILQIANAYDTLNKRPSRMLALLDSVGVEANIETQGLLRNTIAVYIRYGLYDSLGFDTVMGEVLPVIREYDKYLCDCATVEWTAPYEGYGKRLRRKLDSCSAAIQQWDGWTAYKKLIDIMGSEKIRNIPLDVLLAYAMRNCHAYSVAVSSGLPYFKGFSPQEQYLIKYNEFNRRMSDAVVNLDERLTSPYANAAEIKRLKDYFSAIRLNVLNQRPEMRMAFYNDVGKFYFLVQGKVVSMLSYDYSYQNETFRISNVAYRNRIDLTDRDKNDPSIYDHLFRYPLIALKKYGLPLNGEIPEQRVERNSVYDDIRGFGFLPVIE